MNSLLIYLGAAMQFFGAWSIDWAHLSWEMNKPTVGLPFPNGMYEIERAAFWNIGFFGGVVTGSILVLVGALL